VLHVAPFRVSCRGPVGGDGGGHITGVTIKLYFLHDNFVLALNIRPNNSNFKCKFKAFRIKHFMVLKIHQGLFPQTKYFLYFLVPHNFISGGNLMNGISFEMASCQVFIGS
jgi:hypothetical protein